MASLLSFSQYIGGQDNLQLEVTFPSSQKTVTYNFQQDISDWDFKLSYQTVVIDTVTYDRNTGNPNFANSNVIGTFPSGIANTSTYVEIMNTSSGIVAVTLPGNLYSGAIFPDSRTNTPITVLGFTWTTNSTPPQIDTHRWALMLTYEPGVTPGDPADDASFIPLTA